MQYWPYRYRSYIYTYIDIYLWGAWACGRTEATEAADDSSAPPRDRLPSGLRKPAVHPTQTPHKSKQRWVSIGKTLASTQSFLSSNQPVPADTGAQKENHRRSILRLPTLCALPFGARWWLWGGQLGGLEHDLVHLLLHLHVHLGALLLRLGHLHSRQYCSFVV